MLAFILFLLGAVLAAVAGYRAGRYGWKRRKTSGGEAALPAVAGYEADIFRQLIEMSPDSVMLVKVIESQECQNWPIVLCNQRAAEIHGYAKNADMIGLTIREIKALDLLNQHEDEDWLVRLRRQGTLAGETRHRRRDGTSFNIEYRAGLLVIDGQEHYLGIDRDVTARKLDEAALRASEDMFRQMIETCPDSVMLVKIIEHGEWPIVLCNQRTAEMHGYAKREEMIGLTIRDINYLPPQEPPPGVISWLSRLRRHGTLVGENLHRRRDGTPFNIEYSTSRLFIDGQEHYLAIDRDITARKQAEAALKASDDFNRLVLQASNDGIVDADLKTGRMHCSDRLGEMLGLAPGARPATLEDFFRRVHPDDLASLHAARDRHWKHGAPLWHQGRYRHADGSWRWLVARAITLQDEAARPVRMVMSLTDVTGQRRSDEELLQSRKLRAVGEMVGGIAHEFNNLLTPMLVQAGLIAQTRAADRELVEQLRPITAAAAEASELTQRILAFGRQDPVIRETLDLHAVAGDNLDFLRHTLDRRIAVRHDWPAAAAWVEQNRSDLNQIVVNLVLNARDAMLQALADRRGAEWRPEVSVAIATVERPSGASGAAGEPRRWQRLRVTDNGCGISPENCERIFEPFFTTKGVGLGTGLGLATVWHLVSTMGGWIEIDSTLGVGTTMTVHLPAAEPPQTPPAATPALDLAATAATRPVRVLLVEDNDQVAAVLRSLLELRGHAVTFCPDGGKAWQALAQPEPPFDLLVTDINLPGKTGLQLVGLIRERALPLRTVVVGGYMTEEVRSELATLQVDTLLPKPFEVGAFIAALAKAGG